VIILVHKSYQNALFDLSPDEKSIAYCNEYNINIFNIQTNTKKNINSNESSHLRCIRYSPSGKYIAHTCDKHPRKIMLLDIDTEKYIQCEDESNGVINSIIFSNNEEYIIGGGYGGITIWDIKSMKCIKRFVLLNYEIINNGIYISPDNKTIIFCGIDNNPRGLTDFLSFVAGTSRGVCVIRFLDFYSGQTLKRVNIHHLNYVSDIESFKLNPTFNCMFIIGKEHVTVLDMNGEFIKHLDGFDDSCCVNVARYSNTLVFGLLSGYISIMKIEPNITAEYLIGDFKSNNCKITHIVISANEKFLISRSEDGVIKIQERFKDKIF
jgi:WD40 repeat protein